MHSSSYKACKGTVLNQAYHSVNRGYPQIPLILMCSTHLQEEWLKFMSSPRLLNAPSPIKTTYLSAVANLKGGATPVDNDKREFSGQKRREIVENVLNFRIEN